MKDIKFERQSKHHESIYEIIESAFRFETNPENICENLCQDVNYFKMEKILEIFIYQKLKDEKLIKELQHFKDTSVGLFCTDKPEKLEDKGGLLFELK